MKRFFTWARMVITGWYVSRLGTPPPFAADRLKICKDCAFNSANVKKVIRIMPPYCTLCKCDLKAKACSIGGKCELNKWPVAFDFEKELEKLLSK